MTKKEIALAQRIFDKMARNPQEEINTELGTFRGWLLSYEEYDFIKVFFHCSIEKKYSFGNKIELSFNGSLSPEGIITDKGACICPHDPAIFLADLHYVLCGAAGVAYKHFKERGKDE